MGNYKPYKPKKKPPVQQTELTKERSTGKQIQWFPGHMAKAKREIAESLKMVDIAIELCDARIPDSSRNPQIKEILGTKPSLLLMNKSGLADPRANERWKEYYNYNGEHVLFTDMITGAGVSELIPTICNILKDKMEAFARKGMIGRIPRAMIIGITNAGKSTLINRLYGNAKTKTEDRPGVTRNQQWVTVKGGIELLDTPGILWPKFEDENIGLNLAFTGAIRDEILDKEEIAVLLCGKLRDNYPDLLAERFKLEREGLQDLMPHEVFEQIGRKRGFLISGGEVDSSRCAAIVLDEFRGGKIGRITLELPPITAPKKEQNDA